MSAFDRFIPKTLLTRGDVFGYISSRIFDALLPSFVRVFYCNNTRAFVYNVLVIYKHANTYTHVFIHLVTISPEQVRNVCARVIYNRNEAVNGQMLIIQNDTILIHRFTTILTNS